MENSFSDDFCIIGCEINVIHSLCSTDNYCIVLCQINTIHSLCNHLNSLRSQETMKAMFCDVDCCVGNSVPGIIETLIETPHLIDITQSIIGEAGIKLLQQFNSIFEKIVHHSIEYYDYDSQYNVCHDGEKKILRQQRWLAFFDLVNTLDTHLKESVNKLIPIK
jgi:hypothetical protein